MEQLTLTGDTQETPLTERQQYALELIESADGGLASDELGAAMHERRGKHDRGVRCQWCQQEGQGVGRELRRKRVAVQKRSRRRGEPPRWVPAGSAGRPNRGAQTDIIPF